jgi:putative acetyltransferase
MSCGRYAKRLLSPPNALALTPLAVQKAMQASGLVLALVRHAIEKARALKCDVVFVLGDTKYYARFDFSAESAASVPSPYAGAHFMALRITAPVIYAPAFAGLA